MFVARWTIVAKFGHKTQVQEGLQAWLREVGQPSGAKAARQLMTGSIGAPEGMFVSEMEFATLAELEAHWARLGSNPKHVEWSKTLEPHVVSGSNRWEIFRVIE